MTRADSYLPQVPAPLPPGPWKFVGNSWQYTTIYDANDRTVCRLDLEDWGVTEDNQEVLEWRQLKVARLIAAAPGLLEALKRIAVHASAPNCFRHMLEIIAEDVRAAIAKATGETP